MSTNPAPTPIEQRELVLTRTLNVPREKLFRAWTEPERLKSMSKELDGWLLSVVRSLNGGDYR